MERALELAARGRGATSPNPMVGAVIVRDGVVVAQGWHHRAGGPHAEIEALAVADDVRGATMVVTLEPCCHVGRTGPCTQAIIAAGIARVVVAALDPNPLVAGRGVAELAAAGIEVITGVMAEPAVRLNRFFNRWITTRRPWLILKLAMSIDGRIAARPGERTAVTSGASWSRVQAMRAASDAVLVGRNTAVVDRPRLTLRAVAGEARPPWRVLVDSRLETPLDVPMLGREPPGVIAACALDVDDERVRSWTARGVHVISRPDGRGRVDLLGLMGTLGALEPTPLTSILCEGGGVLAASLLEEDLIDELAIFVAPALFGAGGVAAVGELATPIRGFALESVERVGDDVVLSYQRER